MGMREDFDAAIEATDGAEDDLAEMEQEIVSHEDDTSPDDIEAADDGAEAENADSDTPPEDEGGEKAPESAELGEGEAGEEAGAAKELNPNDSLKAPEDWSPKARGDWSKIPQDLQKVIKSREEEFAAFKTEAAEATQAKGFLDQLQNNYAPILAAEGVSAPAAIKGLFETVSQLRMGSDTQKAQAVANIISDYGIDINALDNVLVGSAAVDPQQTEVERLVAEQMKPMQAMFEQHQSQQRGQQEATTQQANSEVAEFTKTAEFINDVRNDMADMLDAADRRGVQMTLQQAYDKSCAIHPEISNILAERAKNAQIMGGQESIAAKKAAASPLAGKQHGLPQINMENMSIRDSINRAWEGE